MVSVVVERTPTVPPARRDEVAHLPAGFHQVVLRYGFMEEHRVADDLQRHVAIDPVSTDYFVGRETIRVSDRPGMARWREVLFALMTRNASDVTAHFHLPDDRVTEIGQRVEL